MSHTHNKQRKSFDLVFIIEIDSAFLWCKTFAHGWSRQQSFHCSKHHLVCFRLYRQLYHEPWQELLVRSQSLVSFSNAFDQFKISPVAFLIFIQRNFFHLIIAKNSYSTVLCVWVKYKLSDIRRYKIQQVLSSFHKAFPKSK